jgi:hypothetical protein
MAEGWVNGGNVPIFPSQKYLSEERSGTQTPDEVLQRSHYARNIEQRNVISSFFRGNVSIRDCDFDFPQFKGHIARAFQREFEEEALILCFSRVLSHDTRRRLGKEIAIRIDDPAALLRVVSEQIGIAGEIGVVGYTRGPERGHFVKSFEDAYMAEVRMIWKIPEPEKTEVAIPGGLVTYIPLEMIPDVLFAPKTDITDYDRALEFELRSGLPIH